MYAIKSFIVVALAATASAMLFDGQALRREVLQARATNSSAPYPTATASSNSSGACSSVLQGLATLITGLPTPTGDLYSYLQTAATTLTDPCHLSVPSSIAPAFSTYESSVISFYSAHQSQLNSALQACPSLTSLVANPVCSTASTGSSTTATIALTTTTTTSLTASSSPSAVTTGGANDLETSMMALLVAGLFGFVVAALKIPGVDNLTAAIN